MRDPEVLVIIPAMIIIAAAMFIAHKRWLRPAFLFSMGLALFVFNVMAHI